MNDIRQSLVNLIPILREAMTGFIPKGKKVYNRRKHGGTSETKKGCTTHKVNPTFHSIRRSAWKPAEYRKYHMGKVTITPTYLLPHAKPRGLNVVSPAARALRKLEG